MSSTEALELGKILVDIPVEYRAIKELLIRDHANEYGSLSLTLILAKTVEEDVIHRLEGQNIRILTPDGKEIFAGICSGTGLLKENQYAELRIEAKSHAWITDRTPKSRTFQSAQKTLLQVAQAVMGDYPVVLRVKQDMPISRMLSQQEETDWQFLKRIANQCGLLVFTNVKSSQIEIHIGTIPFSAKALQLTGVYEKKDIAACLSVKLNTRKEASVYEFLQTGGSCGDLTAGSGALVRGKNADCIITESDIRSDRGVLYNHVLLTYSDGAVPRMEEAYAGSSPSYTSVLIGKVLQVSGTDIQVQFDDGAGGVRWIPYTSALGNDIYAMPDENDTVFCYYDNSGEIVALGSKTADTSYPDFEKPEERSLTACNRMIKFKGDGIDLTGNRAEYDGKGGNQVKITFSDTEGIDIAASGDIHIGGQKTVLIQAKELPEGETMPTAWFDESFSESMEKFKAQQQEGSDKYVADKGAFKPYDPVTDLVCTVGGSFVDGFVEELKSPLHIVDSVGSLINMVKGEDEEEMPKVQFAAVEDKRVSAIALESLYLIVGDSGIIIGKDYIMIDAQRFQQSGFDRKTDYPEVSESQRTGMDIFMDFAKLAVDIACLFCPALWGLKLVSAGLSLLKGDYYGAAMSLIPFSSAFKAVDGVVDAVKTANQVTKAITVIIAGAEITASALDAGMAIARIYQNFKKNGWDALTDLAMWDDMLCVGQSSQSICGSVKDIAEVTEKPKPNNTPEGDSNKESDNTETPEQSRQQTEADPGKPENATDCGDPIDVVTGSQKVYQTEFVIRDLSGSFTIRRYYESIYKNSGSLLGERWYLSVGSYLTVREDRAVILLPNRHLERFVRRQDGTWENLRGSDGSVTLREKDRQYLLHCRKEEKTYHYDFDGKLVSIEDRNGNQIRLKYMGAVLVEMDFPSGQMLSFAYEDGKLSSMTDIIGRQVQYRYEGELLTEVTYPNGGTITYAYTPEGYLCGITDQNGNPYVRNEYTRDGRVTRQFLNGDTEYVILYDDNNRVNTFLNMTNNDRLEFHYNSSRLVVKTVYSDGSSEEARYDERENKAWEKDRRGYELTRRFNTDSMLLEENLPSGLTTYFAYDENGRLSRKWDNGGKKQWYTYDGHGNPVEILQEITEGVMQRVRFSYDDRGRITEILDANGNATRYTYEGANPQPSAITTPEEHTLRYTYDKAGRCMEITGEQGTTGYAYNHMDCVTMVTNPLGEVTKYYYDALCNLTKVVKPNQTGENGSHAGTQYVYDALDTLIMTIDPLGNVRATPRDVEGNILKEIHPNAYDARTGDGEGICYAYDVCNNRTRIRYPDGGVERICYDAMGHITRKIAPLEYDETRDDGRGWSYTYDEVGRLIQITDPEGTVQKRYVYDLHGNIVKLITAESYLQGETDEERPGELYGYNALGWLTEVRKPVKTEEDGRVLYQLTQYRYDPAGNMIREIRYRDYQTRESAAGAVHTISYEYDKDNRRIRVSDCTGAAVEYRYDSANRRIYEKRRINDTTDQIFTYAYDAAGRLTEVRQSADEEGCGRKMTATAYEYDHNGNLTRIRLPYGAEVRREYDAADRITAEHHLEKATGIRTTTYFTYDKADNLTAITDNRGNTVHMEYNLLNQEIRRTERDGGVTGRSYDLNGRLSRLIRPNEYHRLGDQAHGEQYTYDSLGRLLEVTRPDGSFQARYTYAPSGRLTAAADACGNGIRYTYDIGGRRIQAATQGGSSQQYEYDAFGNITGVMDGEGNRTQYVLDEWGRIVEIKRADGASEFYRYDYAGNITRTIDGEGNAAQYEYGANGQLIRMTDPTGESETYGYDLGNRLCRKTDRNGIITTYTYNLYGSLTGRRAQNPAVPGTRRSETYEYTPEGLLKSAISSGSAPDAPGVRTMGMRYSYEYDAMNRLIQKSASGRALLSFAYDLNGNLIRQEDVTGKVTQYEYNDIDILEKVKDNDNQVAEYTYYPDGTIKSLRNGSLYTEYAYDADRNLTGIKTLLGTEVLVDNRYVYDHNGNRTEKQQLNGTTRYTYDSLSQLTKVEYPSYTEELYYDRAGNRSRRVSGGMEELYQYDPRNRLTEYTKGGMQTTFTYDNAGNLLADDKARYTYDAFQRTEKVETFDGHIQINRYDAEGLRHELEEDGKLVQFIFRGQEVAVEETENKVIRFIRGYDLIASDAESARTYYHYASDEMGSITHVVTGKNKACGEEKECTEESSEENRNAILAENSAGSVLNRYEYDAWGNLTFCEETVENRFKFNGQQYDPVSQQYYLRARFYNPVIARFTQEDTYRGDGLNLYAYCTNNPVYYVDPSGHQCDKDANDKQPTNGQGSDLPALPAPEPILALPAPEPVLVLPGPVAETSDTPTNGPEGPRADEPNNHARGSSESGSNPKNVFPENPDDLLPEIPRNKATKANGTTSQTIQTSDNIRIRAEQHPLLPGETYNPRHHGVHYHVEYKVDPTKSWNNKNNVKKWYPEGYTPGAGSGFIPGEPFPE